MIDRIKGILAEKTPVSIVVETAMGICFEIRIPISTYEKLPPVGKDCTLYTHLHISQDDIRIYGFSETGERRLFQLLNKISGIGPKIALSVLSTMPISMFVKAVERNEEGLITKVPGIGKKSAQRMIVELKGNIAHLLEHVDGTTASIMNDVGTEVENALVSLGFNLKDIRRELALMPADVLALPSEQIIKETIKRLYQRSK